MRLSRILLNSILATQCWLVTPIYSEPLKPSETTQKTSKPAQIDKNGVLILLRSTLLALDHANKTGNYTVLRDLSAPGFQINTAAKLGDIFANQRRENFDLSGVSVMEPQLTLLPEIDNNGMLRMAGFFPSIPKQINFELLYAPVQGQWRLFGMAVNVGTSAPIAPMPSSNNVLPTTKLPPAAQRQN